MEIGNVVPAHEWGMVPVPWSSLGSTVNSISSSKLTSHEGDREALQEEDWTTSDTWKLVIVLPRTTVGTAIARNAESLMVKFHGPVMAAGG